MTEPNRFDELPAPLDLLLVNSTRSFAGRMMPNQSWARLGGSLARQPRTVADQVLNCKIVVDVTAE